MQRSYPKPHFRLKKFSLLERSRKIARLNKSFCEVPPTEETTSLFPAVGEAVSLENFMRLTKIPIVVYFGDNIPSGDKPVANWGQDNWRTRLNLARKWAAGVNKYGGDAQMVYLPDVGLSGNTHFLMADLNNVEVADIMERWLKSKDLAR